MSFLIGVLLSLSGAILKSGKSLTTKRVATQTDSYTTAISIRAVMCLVLGVGTYLLGLVDIPVNSLFWVAVVVNSVIYTVSGLLIIKAFELSDVSLISPLLAFVPVSVLFPAWIFLGQQPTLIAGMGILLITVGAYVLQYSPENGSLFEPFQKLSSDTGVQYVSIAVLMVSITPTIDKIGLEQTSPFMWGFLLSVGMLVVLILFLPFFRTTLSNRETILDNVFLLFLIGVCSVGVWIVQLSAYKLIDVAYVQAIKRASLLFTIGAGSLLFDESNTRMRLIGGTLILIGVVAIALGG